MRWRPWFLYLLFVTLSVPFETFAATDLYTRFQQATVDVPPGAMISVESHRLHVVCVGRGPPTVVLEAGIGEDVFAWLKVQELLAGFTRVCSYDRAGYGWSDRGPKPRTLNVLTAELDYIVRYAADGQPVILVGPSLGGLIVQHYARNHPILVQGLILLDSMHPEQFERFRAHGIDVPDRPGLGSDLIESELLKRPAVEYPGAR